MRSVDHVLKELNLVKQEFPFITNLRFSDDNFLNFRSLGELEYFAQRYKKEIGLIYQAMGISPRTSQLKEKLEILIPSGLYNIRMGIESGHPETLKLYNRQTTPEAILKSIKTIDSFRSRMDYFPFYDIIFPAVLENWEEDFVETNKFLAKIKKPFHLNLFNLMLYPGTALFDYFNCNIFDLTAPAYKKKYYLPLKYKYIEKIYYVNAWYPLGFYINIIMNNRRYKRLVNQIIIDMLFALIPAVKFLGRVMLFARKKVRRLSAKRR